MSNLGLVEFAVLRDAVSERTFEVIMIWRSLSWEQKRVVSKKFGLEESIPEDHLIRFFPDAAAYLIGMNTEAQ